VLIGREKETEKARHQLSEGTSRACLLRPTHPALSFNYAINRPEAFNRLKGPKGQEGRRLNALPGLA